MYIGGTHKTALDTDYQATKNHKATKRDGIVKAKKIEIVKTHMTTLTNELTPRRRR
jgi:hypothetical protein